MDSIFEILMDLPLFQGVSREKLSELIEKTPLPDLKFRDGQPIVNVGDPCSHIRFVISGMAVLETSNYTRRILVCETVSAPAVLAPEYLFGLDTCYPFTATAKGTCGVLQITKADYINILHSDKVFLFNALNILSRKAQQGASNLLAVSNGTIAERLALFVLSLTHHGAKEIVLSYKQKDMCTVLGVQRSSFITAMTKLHDDGAVRFNPTEIIITDRSKLLDILHTEE